MAETVYAVIYRTGGTERWTWRLVMGGFAYDAAKDKVEELHRAGYAGRVVRASELVRLGMPTSRHGNEKGEPVAHWSRKGIWE